MGTGLERIRQLSREHPNRKLQTLMHAVNAETLKAAHAKQETGKAAGVDKETKASYGENLEANIEDLLKRMKRFSYRPQQVRRTYIEKGDGKLRPLGIPAYEDKLVQSVMADVLNAIYEPKFYAFSHGYREGKSNHGAVKELVRTLQWDTKWVVDADIKGFFDNVSHEWMMKFLEHDIADKNFLRYIVRFMKSGYLEDGVSHETDKGVPQGGLISPVMANVYLHYALDMWFENVAGRILEGKAKMVRFADDAVFCFELEEDARAFNDALRVRLAKFGLEVSEEKTRIIQFGKDAGDKGEPFDFLGFTFYGGTSRKGSYTVKLRTSEKKLKAKRQAAKAWLRQQMHQPIRQTVRKLNVRMAGHYRYYGVTHNSKKMGNFYEYVVRQLFNTLRRRSQKDKMNWENFNKLLLRYPIRRPSIRVNIWK